MTTPADEAPNIWGREPAMILQFLGAVISLAIGFGLKLTTEQFALIMVVVQLGLGLITRSQVSSPATVAKLVRR
jgi:hypothetical protein